MKVLDKINLGCGQRFHPKWLNADLQPASSEVQSVDLSRALPYPNGAFSVVYHSNVLEHIRPGRAEDFMRECARICRTEGVLRVAVPDLEQICRLYLAKLQEAIRGNPGAREERAWMLLELVEEFQRSTVSLPISFKTLCFNFERCDPFISGARCALVARTDVE
jgi:predicted SAM-dependent methyltransferase